MIESMDKAGKVAVLRCKADKLWNDNAYQITWDCFKIPFINKVQAIYDEANELEGEGKEMIESIEIREYWQACDDLFRCGIDTSKEIRHIREINYNGAWMRLLDAGYTPEQALKLRA